MNTKLRGQSSCVKKSRTFNMSKFGKNNWKNGNNSDSGIKSPTRLPPPPLTSEPYSSSSSSSTSTSTPQFSGNWNKKRKVDEITPSAEELPTCSCETKQCVEKKTSGANAKNPNREFFTCNACGDFLWADEWDGSASSKMNVNKSKQYGKKTNKIVPVQKDDLLEKLNQLLSGGECTHNKVQEIHGMTDEIYPLVIKMAEVIQRLENKIDLLQSLQNSHMGLGK